MDGASEETIDREPVLKLFRFMAHHLSAEGVLTGAIPGEVRTSGRAAAIVNEQGILLGGDPGDTGFFRDMNRELRERILPERSQNGRVDYVVFAPVGDGREKEWESAQDTMLDGLSAMSDMRVSFGRDLTGLPGALPEGIEEVTPDLLSDESLRIDPGVEGVRKEIRQGWPSLEAFFARGFGTVARLNGRIAGWCLTDWVVGDACEIGIETYEGHRRQGWGSRMARGTLLLAVRRGLKRAGWQCWLSNTGSMGTARSAGFTETARFPIRFGWTEARNTDLINGIYWMQGRPGMGILPDPARAARHYDTSLGQGWDWGGAAWLYWNAAYAHHLSGHPDAARRYLALAREKGWRYPESLADSGPSVCRGPEEEAVAGLASLPG